MNIVVIGATGLIGSKLVKKLRAMGEEVLAASADSGVNTLTGAGLAEALAGAHVVVDVSNSPSFEDEAVMTFFKTATANLLAAAKSAGVRHHVALSIVGTDRLQESGYMRAKLAQENLIKSSGIPYTIVRSTQFFEFIGRMAQETADGKSVRVSSAYFQPIASDDVVAVLADVAVKPPLNGTMEVAGAERFRLDDLVRRVFAAKGDTREVITDGGARYFGAMLGEQSLTPEKPTVVGTLHFEQWLSSAGITTSARMTEGSFEGVDGVKIFTRAWQPADKPHGVVVISHGLNAHSGLYAWAAQQFTAHGLAVYALDHRGRGRSEGERFFVKKFADWTQDLATFIDIVKAHEPGLPVFLLGHSAGGVIACGYALEHQDEIAGLICEDFAYQVPAPHVALAIVSAVSHVAPHAHVLKLKNEDFSRDPAVVAALNADPLIANESQPSETVAELVRADELLKKSFGQITLPLLILHGTADKVTKPSGSQEFYEKAGSSDKTLKLYEGHFHDLLADVGKRQVMADIQAWIDAHLATEIPRTGRDDSAARHAR
jgi:alpha-beta hydrolase superfamily lysophospholipase/uncharacterized protein YbjT (DUF2867 family)